MTDERWVVIPFAPTYSVSSWGRVKSNVRKKYKKPNDLVSANDSGDGYLAVTLDGKRYYIHRLVNWCFNGPPPTPAHETAHNNGVNNDNVPGNVRWATKKENQADRKIHGTDNYARGEDQGHSILKVRQVKRIKKLLSEGETQQSIADKFGVARTTISNINNGYNWRHV